MSDQITEGLERVHVPRASDVLADTLRQRILSGELAAGTHLPVERELAGQTGLSRTVVREALRMLELEGLVRTRAGRNGGTVVHRPTVSAIIRSVNHFAQAGQVRFESLLEARELIEPICAGLAAARRDEEQLQELQAIHERLSSVGTDAQAFETENINWHVAVARASNNELLASFVEGISSVMKAGTENRDLDAKASSEVVHAHGAVMQAIRAQDPEAAERRMRRHIVAFRRNASNPARGKRTKSRSRAKAT